MSKNSKIPKNNQLPKKKSANKVASRRSRRRKGSASVMHPDLTYGMMSIPASSNLGFSGSNGEVKQSQRMSGRSVVHVVEFSRVIGEIRYDAVAGPGFLFYNYAIGQQDSLLVHPDDVIPADSEISDTTKNYARYRFTKLVIKYGPSTTTTVQAAMAFGFYGDGAGVNTGFTFANMLEIAPMSLVSMWIPTKLDVSSSLGNDEWFYMDVDAINSDAANRQTYQGVIPFVGQAAGDFASGARYGFVSIDATLELTSQRPALDLALRSTRDEKRIRRLEERKLQKRRSLPSRRPFLIPPESKTIVSDSPQRTAWSLRSVDIPLVPQVAVVRTPSVPPCSSCGSEVVGFDG